MSAADMSPDEDEQLLDLSADDLLDNALIDYAESLEDAKRETLLSHLEKDETFYQAMSKALNEMAMLIAAAAVLDDSAEFNKRRKLVLFEARADSSDVRELRLHYLHHRNEVDMERLLRGDEEKARFDSRLQSFLQDYSQLHPQG